MKPPLSILSSKTILIALKVHRKEILFSNCAVRCFYFLGFRVTKTFRIQTGESLSPANNIRQPGIPSLTVSPD
jgi:hypothetical protein